MKPVITTPSHTEVARDSNIYTQVGLKRLRDILPSVVVELIHIHLWDR